MKPPDGSNRRVHMANERTFLAWVRTSIAIMAFGFVVEKFAIFLQHLSAIVCRLEPMGNPQPPPPSYTSWLGQGLVGLGAFLGVMAFVRYKRIERQIEEGAYRPSILLDLLLAGAVASVGIFLIILLGHIAL
jgi:uncharacterized membrane protein YidH (DUF202 family)